MLPTDLASTLTVRDYIAIEMTKALLSGNAKVQKKRLTSEDVPVIAYQLADALISESTKK